MYVIIEAQIVVGFLKTWKDELKRIRTKKLDVDFVLI